MNPDFWKNKKVFLTGHTGFKGGWSVMWLKSFGAVVTGYSLEPPSRPSLFESARISEGIRSVTGDLRDFRRLKQCMEETRPDVVIHMAAQPLVRESYRDPIGTYATNVLGTVHLLEAVRQLPDPPVVINVTTDKCYENREWVWGYRENEPLGGADPYSSSKACSEIVTSAYRDSYFHANDRSGRGVALATCRAGNVIGGGDWAEDRLVPDVLRALMEGREPVIRNPNSTRPWQHVLDPLNGYFLLIEKLFENRKNYAEAWNFGPDEDVGKPVSWIVERLSAFWGKKIAWVKDLQNNPHEARFLKLNCSKAKERLGWRPKLGVEKALQWTADWFKAYAEGSDMRFWSESQIREFMGTVDAPSRAGESPALKEEHVPCL
ncbi:MAG: CDP-glucose 4,6-dehydratase [Candidatus Omnitrophota bacterium]